MKIVTAVLMLVEKNIVPIFFLKLKRWHFPSPLCKFPFNPSSKSHIRGFWKSLIYLETTTRQLFFMSKLYNLLRRAVFLKVFSNNAIQYLRDNLMSPIRARDCWFYDVLSAYMSIPSTTKVYFLFTVLILIYGFNIIKESIIVT